MGFAPIKWTCTAFFRPRQLTDRAILASRQTQEKKTKFLLGNRPYEALKKTFWKNCYFSFKKIIGRSPKEFKEVFEQQHLNKKSYRFSLGKTLQKETLKKTMWQNRLISKKKSSLERRCNKSVGFYALFGVVGGFAEWKKGMRFSASVDFHALFGLVGGVCGAEKGHAFWSKSVDFYAKGNHFEVSGRG